MKNIWLKILTSYAIEKKKDGSHDEYLL